MVGERAGEDLLLLEVLEEHLHQAIPDLSRPPVSETQEVEDYLPEESLSDQLAVTTEPHTWQMYSYSLHSSSPPSHRQSL